MKRFALVMLTFLLVGLTTTVAATDPAGVRIIDRPNGTTTESYLRTVDPAVPWSLNTYDYARNSGPRRTLDETGQMLWDVTDPTGMMNNVAISDDGSVVAIGIDLNNQRLEVLNGQTGAVIYDMWGTQGVASVAITSSGDRIAYANGNTLYLMTATNSTPVWTADMSPRSVAIVGMSRQGDHIVLLEGQTSQNQDSLHVWCFEQSSSTPIWTRAFPTAAVSGWYGVKFSGDGQRVVVTANQRIWVFDPANGQLVWSVEANNTQYPAKISNNGRVITTGSNAGTFRAFGWDQGQQTYVLLFRYSFTGGSSNWATASAVSGDGSTVACGSMQFIGAGYAGYVAVFETYGGGVPIYLSPTMYDLVSDVEISDNGLTIAAASWGDLNNPANPNIMVFDKYNPIPFFTYAHPGSPNDLAFNPAGTRLFAGGKAVHNRQFGNGGHGYLFSADLEGGTVSGTVTVSGGGSPAGVTVEAQGQHRSALTDASGVYHIYNVPAGIRTIVAHKLGLTTSSVGGVNVVNGGSVNNINFALSPVASAPANLTASQAFLTRVHLGWDPMTMSGLRHRDEQIRLIIGDEDPVDARGPVALAAPRENWRRHDGWQDRSSPLDDLDEPDSIRVYRGTTQGGPYSWLTSVAGTAVAYDDSFRTFPTVNYYYVVTALYSNGESVYSNETMGRLDAAYLVYNPTVPAMTTPVTFDGVLSPNEWADAVRIDASDVFGYDAPNRPQTVFLYMKYDDANDLLLLACEDHNQTTLEDGEGFGIYDDDDNNNVWSYNRVGTEGNYWAYYYSSGSTLRYRSLSGGTYGSAYYNFVNPHIGFSVASGYFSGEVAIPMGFHNVYDLALYGPDRTPGIGFFVTNRAGGGTLFDGWWPQNIPSIVSNPDYYGNCSIQATLYVPPVPPSGISITPVGSSLRVNWTDPTTGIDSMALHQLLDGINIYRNGQFLDVVAPGTQTYLNIGLQPGSWNEYSLSGFIPEGSTSFEGPLSMPVGAYVGDQPVIDDLVWDDGSFETWTYVTYPYDGNRMAQKFDMPAGHSKVYTMQFYFNSTHPIGVGVAADNGGVPGAYIAGPYTITPIANQYFTFHIPGLEQPTVTGSFWISVDWPADSPLDPYMGVDTNPPIAGRSYYFTNASGWMPISWGNLMIRAGVGVTALPSPAQAVVSRSGDDIRIGWQSTGAPYYRIYSALTFAGPYTTLEGSTSGTFFIDLGAASESLKFYVVRASTEP